jgi:hypothetical protein
MFTRLKTAALFVLAVLFALLLHLPTVHGRGAVRDVANAVLLRQFKGHLHLGSIDIISVRRGLRASNVSLRDERGRLVIESATVVASSLRDVALSLLGRPDAQMPKISLHARTLNLLFDQQNVPSIATAFDARSRGPTNAVQSPTVRRGPDRGLVLRFPTVELSVDHVSMDYPLFVATIDHPMVTGSIVTAPVQLRSRLEDAEVSSEQYGTVRATAGFSLDIPRRMEATPPTRFDGRLHADATLRGAELTCLMNLEVDGDGATITANGCSARAPLLSRIVGAPVAVDVSLSALNFRALNNGTMQLRATATAGGQSVSIALSGLRDDLRLTVGVSGLNLQQIDARLPLSHASGEIQLSRRGDRIELDTASLRATVGGVEVPPVHAVATLTHDELQLQDVHVPLVGLHAHGSVNLRDPQRAINLIAEGEVRNADAVGFLRQFGLGGSLRYSATIRRNAGVLQAEYVATGRNVRAPGGVRVSSVRVSGSLEQSTVNGINVRARADATGLVAGGFGPLDTVVSVTGDPTDRLRGSFRVNADRVASIGGNDEQGHSRTHGQFTLQRQAGGIALDVLDTRVSVRGAEARLRASVRTRQGQRPVIVAALEVDDQSSADLIVDSGGVHANLQNLSLEWVSRALALKQPLAGQLRGRIGLHQRHPVGDVEWSGGVLPVLGAVTLRVHSSTERGLDNLQAQLLYGNEAQDRPELTATIRAHLASMGSGDLAAVLRNIEHVEVWARRTPVAILQQFVPPGVTLSGGGVAHAIASRTEPNAPLETTVAFDFRHAQVGVSLEAAVARSVFGRVLGAPASRPRPLTVPVRLRGALCATLSNRATLPERTDFAVAFGSDSAEGEVDPPTSCAMEQARFATAIVQTEGETAGPWLAAVDAAGRQLRAFRGSGKAWTEFAWVLPAPPLLSAASVNLALQVGPVSNASWPFTALAGRFVPALARPNLPGTLALQARVVGPMLRPAVHASARLEFDAANFIDGDRHGTLVVSADVGPASAERALIERAVFDIDSHLTLATRDTNQEPVTALFELRTVLDPRELAGGRSAIQTVEIERLSARTTSFDLEAIPWARANRVHGRLALSMTDTDNPDRPLLLNASIRDWRVREQRPSNVSFSAGIFNVCTLPGMRQTCHGARWETKTCFTVSPGDQGVAGCDPTAVADNTPIGGLRVIASAPFDGNWKSVALQLDKTRVAMHSVNFPLESISPLLERSSILRVGGSLTAALGWSAEQPRSISGNLFVHHGELTLERMGMPIREIDLSLAAAGRRIYFSPELTMQMGVGAQRGTIVAEGLIDLAGSQGELARIVLRPQLENLPAVQEGNLFAQITGSLSFDARVYREHMDAQLTINRATLQIPEDSSRSLQTLDDAYGVFVMGRTLVSRPTQSRSYATRLSFRTVEPIVLRRRDFLIGVRADGWLRYANAMNVGGTVDLVGPGNFFELFGKRFTIERLNILLDGSSSLDPLLDVALRYESPSDGRINILVGGRKSAPEIRFTAERYPGASEAEILAILILGRRESRGATDQAAIETQGRQAAVSLLAGILYGLGAGQIQRVVESTGFGFVPTLIAEPGADGTGLSRLGVGVLPSFFGNRVYIEGTANFNSQSGNGGQVLVDATISEHLSLGAIWNQSQTGQRFGVDFFIVP